MRDPIARRIRPAFLKHVAGLLSDPDGSRARSRVRQQGLLQLLPRLRSRAAERRFLVGAEPLLELLADPRVILGGTSAARVLSWELMELAGLCLHAELFEVQVALDAAQDVVADVVAITQIEDRGALGLDHRVANGAVLDQLLLGR